MRKSFLTQLVAACVSAMHGNPSFAEPKQHAASLVPMFSYLKRAEVVHPSLFGRHYKPNQRKRRKLARNSGMHPANSLRA